MNFRNGQNGQGGSRGGGVRGGLGDGARCGGSVGGYRGGGGGGRHGGFSSGEPGGDFERPRNFDRESGTGHGNGFKRDGAGRGNWGTNEDEIPPATEESAAVVEKSLPVEKEGDEGEANKETPVEEKAEKEPEDNDMTLEEYEKVLEEKRNALQTTKIEERKVDTKAFETMQQLSNKKSNNDEDFHQAGNREGQAPKIYRGGYRGGREGRGGRGPREGTEGRGRGQEEPMEEKTRELLHQKGSLLHQKLKTPHKSLLWESKALLFPGPLSLWS
ncbi:hypothetical protein Bca101_053561 [Brassica carinata]